MLSFSDKISACRGEFHIDVIKAGKVIQSVEDHNLVVNTGIVRLAELAAGKSRDFISQIGLGSGSSEEDVSDTSLTDQMLFPVSSVEVTGRDVKFGFFIGTSQANGLAIHEFGLFCSDGVMFSRRVRKGVIEKQDDIELHGSWILHF